MQDAMDKMARINVDELPVVSEANPDKIITMLSKRDIISYYYEKMQGQASSRMSRSNLTEVADE